MDETATATVEKWYELHWELLGGHRGHGSPMKEVDAMVWRDAMKEKYPDDLYWLEPVEVAE